MSKRFQRKSFAALIISVIFVHCGSNKPTAKSETPSGLSLADTAVARTTKSADTSPVVEKKDETPPPATVPTVTPEETKEKAPIVKDLTPWETRQTTQSTPVTTTPYTAPIQKSSTPVETPAQKADREKKEAEAKKILEEEKKKQDELAKKKQDEEIKKNRSAIKRDDLEAALKSGKLNAEQTKLVNDYIELQNTGNPTQAQTDAVQTILNTYSTQIITPTVTTTTKTDSIPTVVTKTDSIPTTTIKTDSIPAPTFKTDSLKTDSIQKINILSPDTNLLKVTPDSGKVALPLTEPLKTDSVKRDEITIDLSAKTNDFQNNEFLKSTFQAYADSKIDPKFVLKTYTNVLSGDMITQEQKDSLISQYFKIIEKNDPALLSQLPLANRLVSTFNLYANPSFAQKLAVRADLPLSLKAVPEKDLQVEIPLMYAFKLCYSVAKKTYSKERFDVYYPVNSSTSDKTRVLVVGRVSMAKDNINTEDTTYLNTFKFIWDAVKLSTLPLKETNLTIVGHTQKGMSDKINEDQAQQNATAVLTYLAIEGWTSKSMGSKQLLKPNKPQDLENRRVEIMISDRQLGTAGEIK